MPVWEVTARLLDTFHDDGSKIYKIAYTYTPKAVNTARKGIVTLSTGDRRDSLPRHPGEGGHGAAKPDGNSQVPRGGIVTSI
jgi:hypothetical protein